MIAAVVPTLDEEATIVPLVRSLVRLCDPVIVADGGSRDLTAIHAQLEGAKVVDVEQRGLGPAYLEAWRHIPSDRWVLHVDAGGSHDYESILSVYVGVAEADAEKTYAPEIVIGSRFVDGGTHEGSLARCATSRLAAFMCRLCTFHNFADWTSGLRAYSPRARALLAAQKFTTVGHAWQMEALWYAARAGMRVTEVPIRYRAGSGSQLDMARCREAIVLFHQMAWTQ